jgi:hypothetical protein
MVQGKININLNIKVYSSTFSTMPSWVGSCFVVLFNHNKFPTILHELHTKVFGGHFSRGIIIKQILDAKYWLPTMFRDT